MLIHPTVERLRAPRPVGHGRRLRRDAEHPRCRRADPRGLARPAASTARSTSRENKRLARRLRDGPAAPGRGRRGRRLPQRRAASTAALFQKLATCEWIRDHQHLAIVGPTGIGKSWLACALGHKACRDGFSVLYKRAPRLFADLAQARGEGRLPRLLATLERTRLLIIDDWGPEPLNAEQRRDLLEIVDDRYDRGSLLITSQVPVGRMARGDRRPDARRRRSSTASFTALIGSS